MKNLSNLCQRRCSKATPKSPQGRPARTMLVGGTMISVLALIVIGAQFSQKRAPANTPPVQSEEEMAVQVLLNPLRVDPTRLTEPEAVAAFSIMRPDIVSQELMKDPAVVKSIEERSVYILNPKLVEAEMLKDPEFRKRRAAAFGAAD